MPKFVTLVTVELFHDNPEFTEGPNVHGVLQRAFRAELPLIRIACLADLVMIAQCAARACAETIVENEANFSESTPKNLTHQPATTTPKH